MTVHFKSFYFSTEPVTLDVSKWMNLAGKVFQSLRLLVLCRIVWDRYGHLTKMDTGRMWTFFPTNPDYSDKDGLIKTECTCSGRSGAKFKIYSSKELDTKLVKQSTKTKLILSWGSGKFVVPLFSHTIFDQNFR